MLYIPHTIDMTVNVDIVVNHLVRKSQPTAIFQRDSRRTLHRARFIFTDVISDMPTVQLQQIGRPTTFHIDHRPDRTDIANLLSILVDDSEITVCEKAIHILYPRMYFEGLVLKRHIFEVDSQARQHPRIVSFVQTSDAEATVGSMKACTIEQTITQYSHCKMTTEIDPKRFGYELILSNFVFFTHNNQLF